MKQERFVIKKTGKRKVFYPDISWLENSEFVSGYFIFSIMFYFKIETD